MTPSDRDGSPHASRRSPPDLTVDAGVATGPDPIDSTRSGVMLASQTRTLELIARGAPLEEVLGATNAMIEDHGEDSTTITFLLEADHLLPRGPHRVPPELVLHVTHVELDAHPYAQALSRGETVVVRDVATDPALVDDAEILFRAGFKSFWSQPVWHRGSDRQWGAIVTFFRTHREPSNQERSTGKLAADLVAIALERFETGSRLAYQSMHDDLTGLPNRVLLLDRLHHALVRARQFGEQVGVLFVDIDRFKLVNDGLGHGVGDQLLVAFAQRLQTIVRPEDTVARCGGDEFVVLSDPSDGSSTIFAIAQRLEQITYEPFVLDDGVEVYLTASMGLALGNGPEPEAMLRNADAAMYRAKERGRNRLEVFDDEMRAAAVTRLSLGNDLRRAIERDEFTVLHQPVIDVATGRIVGAEALVRWLHPTRGLLEPDEFIFATEETGMVIPLGELVLETALAHARGWADETDLGDFTMSVNLSVRQLSSPVLTSRVGGLLDRYRWPANRLCLELTESVLMTDLELTLGVLLRLKDVGILLAIDDFGTGHSSLTYLQQLPVDLIKIDRSFVAGLAVNARRANDNLGTIARAVVGMAHALGLQACAEGVEDAGQFAVLQNLGCDLAQGYLFSKPLTAAEFGPYLAASRAPGGTR